MADNPGAPNVVQEELVMLESIQEALRNNPGSNECRRLAETLGNINDCIAQTAEALRTNPGSDKCKEYADKLEDIKDNIVIIIDEVLRNTPGSVECKRLAETLGDIRDSIAQKTENHGEFVHVEMPTNDPMQSKQTSLVKQIAPEENSRRFGGISWSSIKRQFSAEKKKVQILNPIPTQTTQQFTSALKRCMTDFDCLLRGKSDFLDPSLPLLVVCQLSTRLQPDVDLALENFQWHQPYKVLIVHTGHEGNLPALPSNNKLKGYNNVEFVDMGYDQHAGIYRCRHNYEAYSKLTSYLEQFYKLSS